MSLHHTKEDEWLDRFVDQAESWKIYEVDENEWYLARSVQEACEEYEANIGESPMVIRELTHEEMDAMLFCEDDGEVSGRKTASKTFREELERRIALGITGPELFASTEYGSGRLEL